MCYPKPGPRCSAYAAAAYARAHQQVLDAFMTNKKDENIDALRKKRDKAKKEYDITPAGINELKRQIAESTNSWGEEKLKQLQEERTRRIKAVKNKKQVTHRSKTTQKYVNNKFSTTGEQITPMTYSHPDLLNSINDSEKWSRDLTDEEISTMAWYSQAGFTDINGELSNPNYEPDTQKYSKDRTNKAIEALDSAFKKYHPNHDGVIVYRRHHFYTENGKHASLSVEDIQKQFTPGETYTPPFYLSTSLDPENLPTSNGGVAGLQILTKTGAPVTAISSQGPREYEFIIPRNTKFKIISNNTTMITKDRSGKTVEINIIQLEEITES